MIPHDASRIVMEGLNINTVLYVAQILAIVGGGAVFLFRTGKSVAAMEQAVNALRDVVINQGNEIKELRSEMKQFGTVLTQMAVQKERLDMIASRLSLLDSRVEEMRHGEGFVFPLTRRPPPD